MKGKIEVVPSHSTYAHIHQHVSLPVAHRYRNTRYGGGGGVGAYIHNFFSRMEF